MKTLIRLCRCAGWSESSLSAHVGRYVFSHYGSYSVGYLTVTLRNLKLMWTWIYLLSFFFFTKSGLMHLHSAGINSSTSKWYSVTLHSTSFRKSLYALLFHFSFFFYFILFNVALYSKVNSQYFVISQRKTFYNNLYPAKFLLFKKIENFTVFQ